MAGLPDPSVHDLAGARRNFDRLVRDYAKKDYVDDAIAAIPTSPDVSAVPSLLRHVAGTMASGSADYILAVAASAGISIGSGNGYQGMFYLPAAPSVTGKTANVRLAGFIQGGGAAMLTGNGTVTQRLHVVTSAAGVVTLGTQVISDTLINNTTLAADGHVNHESSYVAHPGAGWYIITIHSTRALDGSGAVASVSLQRNYQ